MTMIVGARDLRLRAAEVIRAVRGGDVVIISYRGKPVAEMRGMEQPEETAAEDVFGMWENHEGIKEVSDWVRQGRRRRAK